MRLDQQLFRHQYHSAATSKASIPSTSQSLKFDLGISIDRVTHTAEGYFLRRYIQILIQPTMSFQRHSTNFTFSLQVNGTQNFSKFPTVLIC